VAATKPPVGRVLLLSKLEETLVVRGMRYELSANRYPGAVHPQGYRYLKEFRLDPFPVFTYEVADVEIEKRVFLVDGENTVVLEYEVRGDTGGCVLEVRPLIAFRDYHATTHANSALDPRVTITAGRASIAPYPGLPTLYFSHDAVSVESTGAWYYGFEFDRERERGLDYQEDLFNPCVLTFDLGLRTGSTIIASTEPREASGAPALRRAEIERRAELGRAASSDDPLVRSLVSAAGQFIVRRGELRSVIAGYHWFSDWGRDTMIALPGLTLATDRPDIAKNILLAFARTIDQGMLPNRFPDAGEVPEYNTVDATLWFFVALDALVRYTGDLQFVKEHLYEKLVSIIDWHERGTRYGIHADSDGLLACGERLTWMDAKAGDWVVTPRSGKPVEVQALWYNALRTLEAFSGKFDDIVTSARCLELALDMVRPNFVRLFWNDTAGCLYDVVDGDEHDASIRPNQIFAVSLPYTMLPEDKERQVVNRVERDLLTPYGLRTLATTDPRYRGCYEGDQRSRDAAYHQGTVWPWLLGPFFTAYIKVNGPDSRDRIAQWLTPFREHLHTAGLGQISEIFDGDPPHHPRGCIAQAWSVAEILRAAL